MFEHSELRAFLRLYTSPYDNLPPVYYLITLSAFPLV